MIKITEEYRYRVNYFLAKQEDEEDGRFCWNWVIIDIHEKTFDSNEERDGYCEEEFQEAPGDLDYYIGGENLSRGKTHLITDNDIQQIKKRLKEWIQGVYDEVEIISDEEET